MSIPEEFIRRFPAYEDVFVGDLEHYRKHFLPICSINLQFLFSEQDERLHYVSVKEIHEDRVGEDTDGKYKFEAEWKYFRLHQKEQLKAIYQTLKSNGDKAYLRMKREVMSLDELEHAHIANEHDYQACKAFFKKNNLFPLSVHVYG